MLQSQVSHLTPNKTQNIDLRKYFVTGGVNAAAGGTLTFMVGADTGETFTRAETLLGDMGAKIVHCGAVGTGGAVKICNNMLLAVSVSLWQTCDSFDFYQLSNIFNSIF